MNDDLNFIVHLCRQAHKCKPGDSKLIETGDGMLFFMFDTLSLVRLGKQFVLTDRLKSDNICITEDAKAVRKILMDSIIHKYLIPITPWEELCHELIQWLGGDKSTTPPIRVCPTLLHEDIPYIPVILECVWGIPDNNFGLRKLHLRLMGLTSHPCETYTVDVHLYPNCYRGKGQQISYRQCRHTCVSCDSLQENPFQPQLNGADKAIIDLKTDSSSPHDEDVNEITRLLRCWRLGK